MNLGALYLMIHNSLAFPKSLFLHWQKPVTILALECNKLVQVDFKHPPHDMFARDLPIQES